MTSTPNTARNSVHENVNRIGGLLKSQSAFHCNRVTANRLYSPATYLPSRTPTQRRFHAMIDRSTVSKLSDMVQGRGIKRGDRTEIPWLTAAAAMAFLRMSQIDVTYSHTAYQVAASRKFPNAAGHSIDFQIACILDPSEWLHLAVGQKDQLSATAVQAIRNRCTVPDRQKDGFTHALRLWNMYSVYVLKLLHLYRVPSLTASDRFERFYQWQIHEAIFSNVCSVWAFFLLSDAPVSVNFKRLNDISASEQKMQLETIVWEIVSMQQLKPDMTGSNEPWILCTVDKDISQIATCVFPSVDREGTLKRSLLRLYPTADASRILSLYLNLEQTAKLPIGRDSHAEQFFRNLAQTQSELEQVLGIRQ